PVGMSDPSARCGPDRRRTTTSTDRLDMSGSSVVTRQSPPACTAAADVPSRPLSIRHSPGRLRPSRCATRGWSNAPGGCCRQAGDTVAIPPGRSRRYTCGARDAFAPRRPSRRVTAAPLPEPAADVLAGRDPCPVVVEPAMELAGGIVVGLGAWVGGDVEAGVGGRVVVGGLPGEGRLDDRAEARRLVSLALLLSVLELGEDLAA